MAEYEIILQSPAALNLGTLDRVHRCVYARGRNSIGEMTLTVPEGIYPEGWFTPFARVLIQRTLHGSTPYVDLETPWFILDGPRRSLSDTGIALVSFDAVDALGLILSARNVAYNDYNEYTYKLGNADDMCKAVVRENMGSLATDSARDLTGYMNVAIDLGAAPIIRFGSFARQQVLDVLQDIADASTNHPATPTWLGFDVVLANVVTGLLEFRTYTGQRGNDHRAGTTDPVILSPEAGNLSEAEVGRAYRTSASVIYAGGAGIADLRPIVTALNTSLIGLSPFGRRERFVDGSQIVDPDALEQLAYSELRAARPRKYLTGKIVETDTVLRGVHWDYGDYLGAMNQDDIFDVHVEQIAVTLEPAEGGGLKESAEAYLRGEQVI